MSSQFATLNKRNYCEISSYYCGRVETFARLRRRAAYVCIWLPAFRDKISIPSSRVMKFFWNYFINEIWKRVFLSQYLTNLMHKICFTISFISCLYMFQSHVLINRRSQPVHETATYRCDDIRGFLMQFWPPDDEHMFSKHVEAWNKTYCETNFVHQVG